MSQRVRPQWQAKADLAGARAKASPNPERDPFGAGRQSRWGETRNRVSYPWAG